MITISVVGLGKLGACMAACLACKGYEVIGVDVDQRTVNLINEAKVPVVEPGLQELLEAHCGRFKATQDYEEAVQKSDITFLITPTPSEPDGHFSDKYLRGALEPLSRTLKKSRKPYHLFVITSTVSPGTTTESFIPLIEEGSGRMLNRGFGVCYNPEFIALGSVIHDFLNPDLVLIGQSSRRAGDYLVEIYKRVCENQPSICRMSIISAEITKLSLNAYVTMKISFANTLANICERIPDADLDAITEALGADKRISPHYLRGGLAFGGPCFPRDNRAFIAFARKYGCEAKLAEANDLVNESQIHHLTELVLTYLAGMAEKSVSILGLAFKPHTPVVEESPAVRLIGELLKEGVKIIVYDPLAMENVRAVFGEEIRYAASIEECVSSSSFWIITSPSNEFKAIDGSLITHNPTTIIDCWRVLDPSRFQKKIKYVAIGRACAWTS